MDIEKEEQKEILEGLEQQDFTVSREKIDELHQAMIGERCDAPEPESFFSNGMYARKISIPAGMTIVGRIHKEQHLFACIKGRSIIVVEGKEPFEVTAGDVFVAEPGYKRVGHAIEDSSFLNVHYNPENEIDLPLLESRYVENTDFEPDHLFSNETLNKITKKGE